MQVLFCIVSLFDLFRILTLQPAHGPYEAENVDQECDDPGNGVGEVYGLHRVVLGNLEDGGNPHQPQKARSHQGNDHGHNGVSDAPQAAHHDVHHAAQSVCARNNPQPGKAGFNHCRTVAVNMKEGRAEQVGQIAEDHAYKNGKALGHHQNPVDAFILSGTVILAGKGNGGLVEGVHGKIHEAFDVVCGRVSCHDNLAERIDGGLDHHIGKGEQNSLESSGKTHLYDLEETGLVYMQPFQVQVDASGFPHEAAHNQKRGDALGHHSGDGHACHVQMHDNHKEKVQHHIDHAGNNQIVQRPSGVTHCPQKGAAEVVNHSGGHPQKVNPKVQRRKLQHISRRLHPDENLARAERAHHRQQDSAQDTHQHCGVDGFAEPVLIFGSIESGGQNICTNGHAHKQVNQQLDQRGIGSHRRQGVVTCEPAHHHNVRGVEQQLQYVGAHQRESEDQHLLPHHTGAHIHFICFKLLFLCHLPQIPFRIFLQFTMLLQRMQFAGA